MLKPAPNSGIIDVAAGVDWSDADLASRVGRRAADLADLGAGSGSRVALVAGNSAAFLADLFAAWSLGATVACLDPALTPSEGDRLIAFLRPAVLGNGAGLKAAKVPAPARQRGTGGLDDPALILFTSGTTGDPKAVVLSFRALLARLALNRAAIGAMALERSLVALPVSFGHGLIGNALTPLLSGAKIVLHPLGLPLASQLGAIVDEYRVTFLSSTPALWRIVLKTAAPPAGGSLRRVHVGSAPLAADLWARIVGWTGCEVVNCYGTTETANWVGGASSAEGMTEGHVGAPWGGRAGIYREGKIEPAGEGEIAVLSPSVMSGYLDRPDLTSGVLDRGWYRTGDHGTVDAAGRIRLMGRLKDQINRAGFKVQPEEIDRLLEAHPDVDQACSFALPDPVSGEIVAVAVTLVNGHHVDAEALRAWCLDRIRRDAAPERFFIIDEMPRTERGKLRREDVRRAVTEIA
jgi:acyl-CoA synthetase (AMP-forming)/AMP-acid ligase II